MKLLQLSALVAAASASTHTTTAWTGGPTFEIKANGEAKKSPTELTFTVSVPKDMYIQFNLGTNATGKKNTDWISFANLNKVGKVSDMFEDAAKKMADDTKSNVVKVSEKVDATSGAIEFVYTRLLDTTDTDDDVVLKCGEELKQKDGVWRASSTSGDITKAADKNGGSEALTIEGNACYTAPTAPTAQTPAQIQAAKDKAAKDKAAKDKAAADAKTKKAAADAKTKKAAADAKKPNTDGNGATIGAIVAVIVILGLAAAVYAIWSGKCAQKSISGVQQEVSMPEEQDIEFSKKDVVVEKEPVAVDSNQLGQNMSMEPLQAGPTNV